MKKTLFLLMVLLLSIVMFAQTIVDVSNTNNGTINSGLLFGGASSGEGIASKRTAGGNQYGLDFYSNFTNRLSITNSGNIGIGTATPGSKFSLAMNGEELGGTAHSPIFKTYSGVLGNNQGAEVKLASFGFKSGNWSALGISGYRFNWGDGWTNAAIVFGYDVDNTPRAGNFFALAGNGNFGIGTASPSARLHVMGNVIATGKVGIGTSEPRENLSVVGGMNVDHNNQNKGALQYVLSFGLASGEAIGSNRQPGDNQYGLDFYAGGNKRMVITNTGNVGIGTATPGMKLTVNGNILAYGTITPSDTRYKKNITPVNNALNKIMSISGYYYSFRTNEFPELSFNTKKQIGVIAQEVEEVVPEVVTTLKNGYKTVDYPKLIPLLIQGMKEQQHLIEKQQQQIDELKKMVAVLLKK